MAIKMTISGVELGSQTSKMEEAQILQAIAAKFIDKQMYLSSLFTGDLVG